MKIRTVKKAIDIAVTLIRFRDDASAFYSKIWENKIKYLRLVYKRGVLLTEGGVEGGLICGKVRWSNKCITVV